MRRYFPLLFLGFFLFAAIFSSANYLAGNGVARKTEFFKTINLYTTLPHEQAVIIAEEFENNQNIGVNIISLSDNDFLLQVKSLALSDADVILADKEVLINTAKALLLLPYTSDQLDIIPEKFKDKENYWTGVWYDPIVFVVNRDYWRYNRNIPQKWSDIFLNKQMRIGITDFLADKAFANLYFTMAENRGETETLDYFKTLHPQIVKYSQATITPVRMCGLAEVDFSIALNSVAMHYAYEEFPLRIIYPQDGSAYMLIGAAILKNSKHWEEAKQFMDWLVQDNPCAALSSQGFYFIPANSEAKLNKSFGAANIKLIDNQPLYSEAKQHKLLDDWVQSVRLNTSWLN